MEGLVLLVLLAVIVASVAVSSRKKQAAELERARTELEPVKKFAFEDITVLGEELQSLDLDLAGRAARRGRPRRLPARAGRLRGRQDRR